MIRIVLSVVLIVLPLTTQAGSTAQSPELQPFHPLEAAITSIAVRYQIPSPLFLKIAKAESGVGKGRRPWPWTVNFKGKGYYFRTYQGAAKFIRALMAAGHTSFDVGCFQINWRWHGGGPKSRCAQYGITDAEQLLYPVVNSHVAASFLRELLYRHRSLYQAVAHYHSSNPQRGQAYVQSVLSH